MILGLQSSSTKSCAQQAESKTQAAVIPRINRMTAPVEMEALPVPLFLDFVLRSTRSLNGPPLGAKRLRDVCKPPPKKASKIVDAAASTSAFSKHRSIIAGLKLAPKAQVPSGIHCQTPHFLHKAEYVPDFVPFLSMCCLAGIAGARQ